MAAAHVLANVGESGVWDGPRSARDLEAIVREQIAFWGGAPYDRYVFLNLITEAVRWTRAPRLHRADDEPLEVAHAEGLPGVAGARQPRALPRLEREAAPARWSSVRSITKRRTTRAASGSRRASPRTTATSLVHRAGLSTAREYLDQLSGQIQELQTAPGRLVQSLEDASFDAWIKHYRPDENSPNTAVSYYTKGAVVAFLLDIEVQRASDGARTLDDVMRIGVRALRGRSRLHRPGVPCARQRGCRSGSRIVDLARRGLDRRARLRTRARVARAPLPRGSRRILTSHRRPGSEP